MSGRSSLRSVGPGPTQRGVWGARQNNDGGENSVADLHQRGAIAQRAAQQVACVRGVMKGGAGAYGSRAISMSILSLASSSHESAPTLLDPNDLAPVAATKEMINPG